MLSLILFCIDGLKYFVAFQGFKRLYKIQKSAEQKNTQIGAVVTSSWRHQKTVINRQAFSRNPQNYFYQWTCVNTVLHIHILEGSIKPWKEVTCLGEPPEFVSYSPIEVQKSCIVQSLLQKYFTIQVGFFPKC